MDIEDMLTAYSSQLDRIYIQNQLQAISHSHSKEQREQDEQ